MKKILLLLTAIIMLIGCSKESPKKYTLAFNAEVTTDVDMELVLEEYDNNDKCVGKNIITNHKTGQEYQFKSDPYAEYIIVRINFIHEGMGFYDTHYVGNIFYLYNKNTYINIEGTTKLQENTPK